MIAWIGNDDDRMSNEKINDIKIKNCEIESYNIQQKNTDSKIIESVCSESKYNKDKNSKYSSIRLILSQNGINKKNKMEETLFFYLINSFSEIKKLLGFNNECILKLKLDIIQIELSSSFFNYMF